MFFEDAILAIGGAGLRVAFVVLLVLGPQVEACRAQVILQLLLTADSSLSREQLEQYEDLLQSGECLLEGLPWADAALF